MKEAEIFSILHEVAKVVHPGQAICAEDSIYSRQYDFSPQEIIYILLLCKERIPFNIDDGFVESLEEISFSGLCRLIESKTIPLG